MKAIAVFFTLLVGSLLHDARGAPTATEVTTALCEACPEYIHNVGLVQHPDNCHLFYQCLKAESVYLAFQMTCGDLYFDPDSKVCESTEPTSGCTTGQAAVAWTGTTPTSVACPYTQGSNTDQFVNNGITMNCPADMYFSVTDCACLVLPSHTIDASCNTDMKILEFSFESTLNDEACHKAISVENGGTVTLTTNEAAVGSQSALFGSTQFLEVPFMMNYFFQNDITEFSISFWVNLDASATGIIGLVNNGNCETSANERSTFRIAVAADKAISATIDTENDGEVSHPFANPSTLTTAAWYHVAVVYDGSNINAYLTSTGSTATAAGSAVAASGYIMNSACPLLIGTQNSGENLHGYIDELILYRKALTTAELNALVAAGTF